jgi:hypothetical protein
LFAKSKIKVGRTAPFIVRLSPKLQRILHPFLF